MLPLRDFWVIVVFSLLSIQSVNGIIFFLIKQRQNYINHHTGKYLGNISKAKQKKLNIFISQCPECLDLEIFCSESVFQSADQHILQLTFISLFFFFFWSCQYVKVHYSFNKVTCRFFQDTLLYQVTHVRVLAGVDLQRK